MTISYHLAGGLSDPQLQQVRALAQRILREIGMEIDHDEIRAFLGQQRGVEVRGKRVCYDEALFEDCLTRQKSQNGDYVWQGPGDPDFAMRPAFYCLNVFDPLNSQVHRAGMADLVPAVRLCDSYDMVGTSPLHPQDVPEPIRQIATARACIANSRWVGKWMLAHNIDEIRCITEMSMLAGRTAPFVTLQMTISPMRLNVEYLDLLWRLRASPELLAAMTIGGGSIPMLGATGPLGLPAAWAQAVAEVVGAYITAKSLRRALAPTLVYRSSPSICAAWPSSWAAPRGPCRGWWESRFNNTSSDAP